MLKIVILSSPWGKANASLLTWSACAKTRVTLFVHMPQVHLFIVSVYGGGHKGLRGSGRREIVEARCVARRPCWTYCRSGYVADLWVQVALNVFTLGIHSQLFPKSEATQLRVNEPPKENILP